MSEKVKEVAHRLIEIDTPVGIEGFNFFGHRRPFGSRWTVEAGTINLKPRTRLTRSLELAPTAIHGVHSTDIFDQEHSSKNPVGNADLVSLFDGQRPSVFANVMHGSLGKLEISLYPEQEEPTVITSGDLGRMMLVDELLYDQGIRTGNRARMSEEHASRVFLAIHMANYLPFK